MHDAKGDDRVVVAATGDAVGRCGVVGGAIHHSIVATPLGRDESDRGGRSGEARTARVKRYTATPSARAPAPKAASATWARVLASFTRSTPAGWHALPVQYGPASDCLSRAVTPKYVPTPTAARPTPPTIHVETGMPRFLGAASIEASGTGSSTPTGTRGGISTLGASPELATRIVDSQERRPAADARTTCAPPSTGIGVPHRARSMGVASSVTEIPSASPTTSVTREMRASMAR